MPTARDPAAPIGSLERSPRPALMAENPSVHALDEMSWVDVAAHLAADARLIIPIGSLEQHGPHLPLGTNTLIALRIADDLSAQFRVLRAPAMSYGINYYGATRPVGRAYAGTATLRSKTLHRAVNELLAAWELHGIAEFIVVTAHRHEPHLDALATLSTRGARVRVLSIWDIDIADLLVSQPGPLHADEAETAVMLHLYPDLVRMDRARDAPLTPAAVRRFHQGRLPPPPPDGSGVIGNPTAATAERGARIYERILRAVRRAVFASGENESDTL
jgi:creatinine amidohydrolase